MTTLEIRDWELDEVVATVTDDGTVETETPLAEEVLEKSLDDDGSVGWRAASLADEEDGETAELGVMVSPGDEGYLYAVADALPSPLEADPSDLPMPDVDAEDADMDPAEKLWSKLPARLKE